MVLSVSVINKNWYVALRQCVESVRVNKISAVQRDTVQVCSKCKCMV